MKFYLISDTQAYACFVFNSFCFHISSLIFHWSLGLMIKIVFMDYCPCQHFSLWQWKFNTLAITWYIKQATMTSWSVPQTCLRLLCSHGIKWYFTCPDSLSPFINMSDILILYGETCLTPAFQRSQKSQFPCHFTEILESWVCLNGSFVAWHVNNVILVLSTI